MGPLVFTVGDRHVDLLPKDPFGKANTLIPLELLTDGN